MTPFGSDKPLKGVKDEALLFTPEEFEKAMSFITTPEAAREWARHAHAPFPFDEGKDQSTRISPDLLDLLSMVSESCAARVEMIWQVTPEEAKARRESIARELGLTR